MTGNPHKDEVTVTLPKDDYQRLTRLLSILRMVDGWCRVNRAIGRFIIFGVITLLILMSQGFDAIRNLFGWKH